MLARHFFSASTQARERYDRQHSTEPSGANHEDVPQWVQYFFRLIEAQQNMPSASAQAAESRSERRSVVSGLTGRQAPLGHHPAGQRPIQLRTETSRNDGTLRRMRQMNMGGVNVEVLGDDAMKERLDEEFMLVEGIDDAVEERPARRRCTQNGVCRRNANIDFGAGRNDLAAQFFHVTCAFSLLDALTNAVAQSFTAPLTATYVRS